MSCFNDEEIDNEEKEFPDAIYKLNKNHIKRNCHFIQDRPRSLKYCFVADIFADNEGANEDQFDHIANTMNDLEKSSPLYTELGMELSGLYEKVRNVMHKYLMK